ncbi:MAG: DedA family protein [Acidobacteriaceae bacterium]|jgi:membrane-associated protein|nr:DedA family protein [Acidobacteriaceae bacterium]
MSQLLQLLLHADTYLLDLVAHYGLWVYAVLFAIVFCETGLVVTPFLPGDSLLFATGALAATGDLDVRLIAVLLFLAALSGDLVNYTIGRAAGTRVMELARTNPRWGRFIRPAYLAKAHDFFERHGGRAIVMGRFVPIVRTFIPFVAGAAEMTFRHFVLRSLTANVAWVTICVGAGYLFGNVPIVKANFSLVVLGIIAVSLLPMVIEVLKHRAQSSQRRPN